MVQSSVGAIYDTYGSIVALFCDQRKTSEHLFSLIFGHFADTVIKFMIETAFHMLRFEHASVVFSKSIVLLNRIF